MNQNLLKFLCFILIDLDKGKFCLFRQNSLSVVSFDCSNLIESCLHLSVPFQIVVNVTARRILCTIVDEGASVSILYSTAWQALGSPQLVSATDQILAFNRKPTTPLGPFLIYLLH